MVRCDNTLDSYDCFVTASINLSPLSYVLGRGQPRKMKKREPATSRDCRNTNKPKTQAK